jgi:hypothetical protein
LAQERAKQIVATQRRAEVRRRRMTIAGSLIAVVVVAIGVLVGVKFASNSNTPDATASRAPASAAVIQGVTTVPTGTYDTVGSGTINAMPNTISNQTPLVSNGKPLLLYVGAEYCPFCAAERWGMVAALSRFGTFSNLGQTHSSTTDTFPNTQTLSFHGSTYTSQYLEFQGVEETTNVQSGNSYTPLDTLTAAQNATLTKYNAAPYVPASAAGSIPFIDFGNLAISSGASFSPQLLAGKSADQIATALANPSDPIAKAVLGQANAFTNLICQMTKNQPSTVCSTTAAMAYQGKFSAASS